jgi:endonuclease/exonuclease/phosphatase family metal-dependent hydrolase
LCTDLNNTQFSKTYKTLSKGRKDTFVTAGKGLGQTFYFSSFPLRIDFIFVAEYFKVNSFEVIEINYSDHYPIMTTLGWD